MPIRILMSNPSGALAASPAATTGGQVVPVKLAWHGQRFDNQEFGGKVYLSAENAISAAAEANCAFYALVGYTNSDVRVRPHVAEGAENLRYWVGSYNTNWDSVWDITIHGFDSEEEAEKLTTKWAQDDRKEEEEEEDRYRR